MIELATEAIGRTEHKRRSILEAATDLFLEQGFLGTSMDGVAARAAVSKRTVYNQFESKEALFFAIVEHMTSEASDRVQMAMQEPATIDDVAEQLRGHAERLLTIALVPRLLQLRRLVIGEAVRFPQLGKALYEGGPGRAIAGLAGALGRWADRGLLAIDDPLVAATQFNWLVMGEPTNRAMFFGDAEPMPAARRAAHIAAALRVFLAAYGTAGAAIIEKPGHPI
jgi:AcrR family transcriptional regulator